MKDFSFNPEIARLYGVDEAIFIHYLHYWIEHNEANGRNYFEDEAHPGEWRHWTFNSAEALAILFPFWTKNKVDKLTRKMRDNGLIHIGNYNKSKFDRTKWYALSDEILSFYRLNRYSQTAESQTAERLNLIQPNGGISFSQTAEPIPVNIPITIPDSKPDRGHAGGVPPTLDQVTAYCLERGNGVDPQRFMDFYASKGWVVGKAKMKDWKAAVRTWEGRRKGEASGTTNGPTTKYSTLL